MYEAEVNKAVSTISEAANAISTLTDHLDREDVRNLLNAAATVKAIKEKAIQCQKSKLAE
jgi:hypothetical protein